MTYIKVFFKGGQAMTHEPKPVAACSSCIGAQPRVFIHVLSMLLCAAVAVNNKTDEKVTCLLISFPGNCLEPSGLLFY